MEHWSGEERRAHPHMGQPSGTQIMELLHKMQSEQRELAQGLQRHIEKEELDFGEFRRAFPNDDPAGHRRFHESEIEAALDRKKLWGELRKELLSKGLWSVLLILVGLVVTGAAAKLGVTLK